MHVGEKVRVFFCTGGPQIAVSAVIQERVVVLRKTSQ